MIFVGCRMHISLALSVTTNCFFLRPNTGMRRSTSIVHGIGCSRSIVGINHILQRGSVLMFVLWEASFVPFCVSVCPTFRPSLCLSANRFVSVCFILSFSLVCGGGEVWVYLQ